MCYNVVAPVKSIWKILIKRLQFACMHSLFFPLKAGKVFSQLLFTLCEKPILSKLVMVIYIQREHKQYYLATECDTIASQGNKNKPVPCRSISYLMLLYLSFLSSESTLGFALVI